MMQNDINAQIEPLLNNVDENFEEIIKVCKPVISYVISHTYYHPPITKDELFHESTIELWRICKKYKNVKVSFATYFIYDLKNYLVNYIQRNQFVLTVPYTELRKKKYKELSYLVGGTSAEYLDDFEHPNGVEEFIFEFEDDRLDYIKSHLSPQEWNLLYDVVVHEKSFAEYGRQNGISRFTARKRWIKLKNKLGIL